MNQQIDAIVFAAPRTVELGKFHLKECAPDEIVVRTLYSMVSSGTELRVLRGQQAGAEKSYPLIPGYSIVGEVVALGHETHGWKIGDLVSARNPKDMPGIRSLWGAQASFHIQPGSGSNQPILLPPDAKPLDYVIAEIAAISWRGVSFAAPQKGETAIVIGQGLIGAFSASWLHGAGCCVVAVDVSPARLERATRRGISFTVNAADEQAAEKLEALCPGDADIVVESSGTSAGLRQAFKLLRRGTAPDNWPRLVLQATYTEEVSLNPHSFFAGEGLHLITPSDRRLEDRQHVVKSIGSGHIRAPDFLDKVVPWREAPAAYLRLLEAPEENFSLVFDWTTK